MQKKYTPEMIQWLTENTHGKSFREASILFNKRFNTNFTSMQIKTACQKRGIKNCKKIPFSEAQQKFIINNYADMTYENIADNLNKIYGTSFKKNQISTFCEKRHLSKNHSPVSKDVINFIKQIMPTYASVAAELVNAKFETSYTTKSIHRFMFQHGIKNGLHNSSETCGRKKPIFSERIITSCSTGKKYIYIKFQDSGTTKEGFVKDWKKKHIWMWEQANGPMPKGCKILFLDNDTLNCKLENLYLITEKEYMNMYYDQLFYNDTEVTKTGVAITKLKLAIKVKTKKVNQREEKR